MFFMVVVFTLRMQICVPCLVSSVEMVKPMFLVLFVIMVIWSPNSDLFILFLFFFKLL